MLHRRNLGGIKLGAVPRVVASVTSAADLRRISSGGARPFDFVEARLDRVGAGTGDLLAQFRRIERSGAPVILTIRSAREGGAWRGSEKDRAALYALGLPSVSAVDVEVRGGTLPSLAVDAHDLGRLVIASAHDFRGTPPLRDLRQLVAKARRHGADVVKIATWVRRAPDAITLFELLREAEAGPLCVIGMGPLGRHTPIGLACAGSCLAYGSFGRAAAPGQLPCGELAALLRRFCPAFSRAALRRKTKRGG